MKSKTKIALVTGAGSGIGRQTALALLQSGYQVILAGRRLEALEATARQSGRLRRNTLVIPTDVTQPESVRALFAQIRKAFGRLDLLFNNAGINVPAAPLDEVSFDQWRSVLHSNLTGPFLCTQAAFRLMKRQRPRGGRIINNGSISAQVPRPNAVPYTASKHGITGLTRATALEGRAFDIVCGQIDIGNAATEMTAKMKRGVLQADGSIATEPTMDADQIARTVVYMAGLPLDTNVLFITIMAAKMPFVGRG